ncbi:hypothetical protein A4S05_04835 [Nostoc sp. KVJ20]|nr:hypothetical protein A4S05_04835 [Nostoc sp. KVJ20]
MQQLQIKSVLDLRWAVILVILQPLCLSDLCNLHKYTELKKIHNSYCRRIAGIKKYEIDIINNQGNAQFISIIAHIFLDLVCSLFNK